MAMTRNKSRVLFVLRKSHKKNTYSKGSFGLSNSSTFVVNKLNQIGYAATIVQVDDSNGIDRQIAIYNPDVVIIEALWVPPAKFAELLRIHRRRKFIIRIHSKAPFLAMEGVAMDWIYGYHMVNDLYGNLITSCNNEQFNSELNQVMGYNSVYLPNIYSPLANEQDYCPHSLINRDEIDVGCFGAIRPLKNQLLQAIAAILFANKIRRRLRFHINGTRPEQSGENVLRNIKGLFAESGHELVLHEWYTHEDFVEQVVPSMDIGLQVSFSESFNIITADFVHAGVPIVVSDDVDWMPDFTRVNPNSAEDIANKLYRVWITRTHESINKNKKALFKYNEHATTLWDDYLCNLTRLDKGRN